MKNLRFTVFLFTLIALSSFSFAQKPRQNILGNHLLQTQWGGNGTFCKYSPENHTLGCHSTAIAQILFYYKLAPTGNVKYHCSNGYTISEDFSDYSVDWNKITTTLTDTTSQEFIDATARYNYSVACIVQKDFGTNQYVDINSSNNHKTQIEEHFTCKYENYSFNTESTVLEMFQNYY